MSEDNLRNPFVVFCKKCNKILTDSFTLNDYRNGYLVHSFSTVKEESRIEVGKDIFQNCLIQKIACACGNDTGVFLASVSGEFNGHANCYAFDKNQVNSYVLGSAVSKEKGLSEVMEDVEKLKSVVAKIYKKVYQ
ncbi:uncharacterized protein VICG_01838 [Vittaforma corneae ATCC 50505]|uniref:Protein yippee-like n=1 Tax=Vittaforma corneae (strain ATCC 50505) TaxID=993615 RepID=L2GKK0_VITCO|nr:uncharacterized protein VICG_01838 [Vittaforma corneae ATCC 50505]ELA41139.1 hypothetical protein VICG_01838 [Vittaforma corneae ATCC 50505]